jgi:hypothetical protein
MASADADHIILWIARCLHREMVLPVCFVFLIGVVQHGIVPHGVKALLVDIELKLEVPACSIRQNTAL